MARRQAVTGALVGAVAALLASQALGMIGPSRATPEPASAATRPATTAASQPTTTTSPPAPQVVVVPVEDDRTADDAEAAAAQRGEILQRLDVLETEIARVRSAPAPAAPAPAAPPPVTEVRWLPAPPPQAPPPPTTTVESSYEWSCGEECVYVTTIYRTEGNVGGEDAGDIDAVTYLCLPSQDTGGAQTRGAPGRSTDSTTTVLADPATECGTVSN